MYRLLGVLLFFIVPKTFSQELAEGRSISLYSFAISQNLSEYNKAADKAYLMNDYQKGKALFEEFTSTYLVGSIMDNFRFQNLDKKEVKLNEFKKPVFLITLASWYIPKDGEISALNRLAKQYGNQIDFIVLYWDKHEKVKQLSQQYHSKINVLYVDETNNRSPFVVKYLKHSLGLPTCFLMSHYKEIKEIRRNLINNTDFIKNKVDESDYADLQMSISRKLIDISPELETSTPGSSEEK
ncbi:redoxin domain-containing protein [Christiangramia salexigens]|uniref:Uncharacterized protein n=1 Tax=Christiangramia salexigens TaxID=1913577 RepID=A0A1L3J3N0_9FLAO|nr:redoxin domain-containing protein [Christiangramia salexigens]APG59723.1 hypothetical protein LPB144_04530 [Christiangramia salexigens]